MWNGVTGIFHWHLEKFVHWCQKQPIFWLLKSISGRLGTRAVGCRPETAADQHATQKEKSQHRKPKQHRASDDVSLQAGSPLTYIAAAIPCGAVTFTCDVTHRHRVDMKIGMTHLTSAISQSRTTHLTLTGAKRRPLSLNQWVVGRQQSPAVSRFALLGDAWGVDLWTS
jgi:hypothetical protein